MREGAHEAPLIGRTSELAELERFLQRAAGGRGGVAIVEGEVGIGKSRLLVAAMREARRLGFDVLSGTAEELEVRRPFGVVADCLRIHRRAHDPRVAEIARLLWPEETGAPLAPGIEGEAEFRISEGILELVERLSAERPVVLAVENLQWADDQSLSTLHRVARHLSALGVAVIVTVRTGLQRPEVARMMERFRSRGLHVLLGPLDDASVPAFIEALIHAEPGPALVRQAAAAGGNPLFVRSLLEALAEEGAIELRPDGTADVGAIGMPSSLTMTILHRLSFLPSDTLEVLQLAAVLGSRFGVTDLSTVTGRSATSLHGVLREALRQGVLEDREEGLAFRHDLIREALYHDIPASVRSALHRDFAYALAESGAPSIEVAEHLVKGSSPGEARAVQWLRDAALEVAPSAPNSAVQLLERASELAGENESLLAALLPDLAVAQMWSGRLADSEMMCKKILAGPVEPAVRPRLQLCIAQSALVRGHVEEALHQALAALESPDMTHVERANIEAWASLPPVFLGDFARATELAQQARKSADVAGDLAAACQATQTLAMVAYFQGHFAEGLGFAEESVAIAERSGSRDAHRALPQTVRANCLMHLDRLEEAGEAVQTGRSASEAFGMKWTLPIYHFVASSCYFWSGRWDDAVAEIEAGTDLAEEMATSWSIYGLSIRSLIALYRDDPDEAEAQVAAAEHEFAEAGPGFGVDWMLLARSLLLETGGRADDAFQLLNGVWEGVAALGMRSDFHLLAPDLLRLALVTGQRGRAEEVVSTLDALCNEQPTIASSIGMALRCRGLLEADHAILVEAARAYEASPRPFERALACEDAAAALAAEGRLEDARPFFADALSLYEGLQAGRSARQAEQRLRQLGLRRGARARPRRPKTGWGALTDTEAKVTDLLAQRLTNAEIADRLFISRHTVHTHVSHILSKLGVSSRVELSASAVGRRAEAPGSE